MCGFVGVYSWQTRLALTEDDLIGMRDTMIARGPDDAGVWVSREGDTTVGLAHRRLSVIDVSELGRQPMSTSDGLLWIVFNGEIFNFEELKCLLVQTGRHVFRSHSDTEVLLYGIREWGLEGCLRRLRGMYAFAVYDRCDGSLTLVRDPLGVKPLYYYVSDEGVLLFASEIKAILAYPGVDRQVNEEGLYHYLTFAHVPAPQTLFRGVFKLEPGTYIRRERTGRSRTITYWDVTRLVPSPTVGDEREYVEELRRLLRQAVARRMVSDVPFGAFLSGGLDSSLNVALMAERLDRPVETFSVGLKDDPANEFEAARLVAGAFGTRHHEVVVDTQDFIRLFPRLAYLQDEPLADPVCVPLYYLSQLTRASGTVVIQVGEGSDELFGGYSLYQLFSNWHSRYFGPYLRMPAALRRYAYRIGKQLSSPEWTDALRRALEGQPLFLGGAIAFWDTEKDDLLKRHRWVHGSSGQYIAACMQPFVGMSTLDQITRLELRNRLPELLLMRVDKITMAHSLEARVPYLDEDVVEFALSMPADLKVREGEGKYLLRQAARGLVPESVLRRKKWGFCGSASSMLNDELVRYAKATILHCPFITERFSLDAIHSLFQQHQRRRLTSFKIWNLLNLALWYECWFEQPVSAPVKVQHDFSRSRVRIANIGTTSSPQRVS